MQEDEVMDILLVEDSDADAEVIARALRKATIRTNRPVRVRDGQEALEFLFKEGAFSEGTAPLPQLILLDLHMPRIDGMEVLRTIKADALTRDIPVVVLTSSAQERDLVSSYKLGATGSLIKPLNFATFAEAVTQAGLCWVMTTRRRAL